MSRRSGAVGRNQCVTQPGGVDRHIAFAQEGLDQLVAPCAGEERADVMTDRCCGQPARDDRIGLLARALQTLAAERGLCSALRLHFDATSLVTQQHVELGPCHVEDGVVLVVVGGNALGCGRRPVEQFALVRGFPGIARAGFGHGFEQAPRRMGVAHEQGRVLQRDFHQRQDEPPVDPTRAIGHAMAGEQGVEQHRHEVDRIVLHSSEADLFGDQSEPTRAFAQFAADGLRKATTAGKRTRKGLDLLALQQRRHAHQFMHAEIADWGRITAVAGPCRRVDHG